MACRLPFLQFEQYCSTEATIGFVLRIVATFARFFSFLIPTSSSRTCSRTHNFLRISVFSLLCCFQLIRHHILRFSNIQCCPALNRRFRLRCVVPNRCHRISYGKLPWDKYEFTRLAHWLDHWPNVLPLQQIHTLLRQSPSESNIIFRLPSFVSCWFDQSSQDCSRLNLQIQVFSRIVHCVSGSQYQCV